MCNTECWSVREAKTATKKQKEKLVLSAAQLLPLGVATCMCVLVDSHFFSLLLHYLLNVMWCAHCVHFGLAFLLKCTFTASLLSVPVVRRRFLEELTSSFLTFDFHSLLFVVASLDSIVVFARSITLPCSQMCKLRSLLDRKMNFCVCLWSLRITKEFRCDFLVECWRFC